MATASPPVPVQRKRAAVRLPKSSRASNVASSRQSAKSAESEDVTVMLNVPVALSERREFKVHAAGEDTSLPDLLHEAVVGVLRRRRPRPSRLARGRRRKGGRGAGACSVVSMTVLAWPRQIQFSLPSVIPVFDARASARVAARIGEGGFEVCQVSSMW